MYYKLELTMYYRLELIMYYYCLWYDKLWGPSRRVVTLFMYLYSEPVWKNNSTDRMRKGFHHCGLSCVF